MTRIQALLALLPVLLITAGLVWQFGPYGLYGGGLLTGLVIGFYDPEKGDGDDGKPVA